jgi:hypothetical protein
MTKKHTELLTWHCLPGQMPDADITVLLSIEGQDEAWPGYLENGIAWAWAGNGGLVRERVLGWAHMPAGLAGVSL